jgi:hypothetical protein
VEWSHRLRHKRAIEDLYALQGAVERWADDDPCTVLQYCEVETHKHLVFIEVGHQPDTTVLAPLIGDCIHNFRVALDHLAYQLAVRVSKRDPPPNWDQSGFPICRSPTHFDGSLPNKIGKRKAMPQALYTALEGLQPYKGGDRELLVTLRDLDDLDKHRFPVIVAGIPVVPSFNIGEVRVSQFAGPRLGPIEPGTPVLEYTPLPDTEPDVNFEFAPSISFGKGSPVASAQAVLGVLYGIRHFVRREVFPTLEPFL